MADELVLDLRDSQNAGIYETLQRPSVHRLRLRQLALVGVEQA
jgi:hypothetical protein